MSNSLKVVLALTSMASGRAMTLAFISRAGDGVAEAQLVQLR